MKPFKRFRCVGGIVITGLKPGVNESAELVDRNLIVQYQISIIQNWFSQEGTIMGTKRRSGLPEPSRVIDRAAEAAGDAGDLGAELLATGVDAATNVIARLTSSPEEVVKVPRRHAKQESGSAKRAGATVKRAAEAAARENRKMARAEGSATTKVVREAQKTGRKVAKAAKARKSTKATKKK
jgi:hypothetical protein